MAGYAAATTHRGLGRYAFPPRCWAERLEGGGQERVSAFGSKTSSGPSPSRCSAIAGSWRPCRRGTPRGHGGEAVKIALIHDRSFFQWLEAQAPGWGLRPAMDALIRRCAELHLSIATSGILSKSGGARTSTSDGGRPQARDLTAHALRGRWPSAWPSIRATGEGRPLGVRARSDLRGARSAGPAALAERSCSPGGWAGECCAASRSSASTWAAS
jgi:hypothetical protein